VDVRTVAQRGSTSGPIVVVVEAEAVSVLDPGVPGREEFALTAPLLNDIAFPPEVEGREEGALPVAEIGPTDGVDAEITRSRL